MKSYNTMALRGHDYTDNEFQEEMSEMGIHIPDELLYTPKMNDYVLDQVNKQTIKEMLESNQSNPETGSLYTLDEAKRLADYSTRQARERIHGLMSLK